MKRQILLKKRQTELMRVHAAVILCNRIFRTLSFFISDKEHLTARRTCDMRRSSGITHFSISISISNEPCPRSFTFDARSLSIRSIRSGPHLHAPTIATLSALKKRSKSFIATARLHLIIDAPFTFAPFALVLSFLNFYSSAQQILFLFVLLSQSVIPC